MSDERTTLFIVFLRFGPNRADVGRWLAGHKLWLRQGIDDGTFLMAGTLDDAEGGVVLAAGHDRAEVLARVEQDPFVTHGVVHAEIHAVVPSAMAPAWAAVMHGGRAGQGAS